MVAGCSFDLIRSAAKAASSRLSANLRWFHATTVTITIDSDDFKFAHNMQNASFMFYRVHIKICIHDYTAEMDQEF